MKCPKCGSDNIRVTIKWLLNIPFKYYHNMSKAAMRNKEIKDYGINWSKASFNCLNCGWFSIPEPKQGEPQKEEQSETVNYYAVGNLEEPYCTIKADRFEPTHNAD